MKQELDAKALRNGAERKSTNTLVTLLSLFSRIESENSDDPRIDKVILQRKIIEKELERRRNGGEMKETASETVHEHEDGKLDITIGLKPLNLHGKANLK
jgi:hypothetical protein